MALTLLSSSRRDKGRSWDSVSSSSNRHGWRLFVFLGVASFCTLGSCFFFLNVVVILPRDLEQQHHSAIIRSNETSSSTTMLSLILWNDASVRLEYHPLRSFPRQIQSVSTYLPSAKSSIIDDASPQESPSFLDQYKPRDEKRDKKNLGKFLIHQFEDDYQNHCVYMKDWQATSYPTCNSVHELGMEAQDLKKLGKGGWRRTWGHQQAPDSVLKLLHLDEDEEFDPRAFEVHRVDAVISQRLTSSPHIVDIYGYCGMTALYEKGVYGLDNGYEDIKLHDKYRLSLQVAKGMADIHGIDYPSGTNATIVHRDLKPANLMMFKNGNLKFGDFNDSHLRQWNKTSNEPCPFYNRAYPTHWGLGYKPAEYSADGYPKLNEKVDIYGLGGLLFFFLTEHNPFNELKNDERTIAIESGMMPQLPSKYNSSQTPDVPEEVQAIVKTIESTMVLDPKARPSAKEVLDMLVEALSSSDTVVK